VTRLTPPRSLSIARQQFLADVQAGLRAKPKRLPCKYFYDQHGSQLFDRICETPEYYLTRTETQIMADHAGEICREIGPDAALIEYGSGSSIKTRILLDNLPDLRTYVPVDISRQYLQGVAEELDRRYPLLDVRPVAADFTATLPPERLSAGEARRVVYFPGSTIGNFEPALAQRLFRQIAQVCGTGGGLLIGFDLQKDPGILEAAYNDAGGVTARFNLNILQRINRELGGDFNARQFRHEAIYEPRPGRMRISLVSRQRQSVNIAGESFEFAAEEPILTEYSHKYTRQGMQELMKPAGLHMTRAWTDPREWFMVAFCEVTTTAKLGAEQ
jgi:dimethylhistidine N-methyltransferase